MRGIFLAFLLLFGAAASADPVVPPTYGECRDHLDRPVKFIGVNHQTFRMLNPRSTFATTSSRFPAVMYDYEHLGMYPHEFIQMVLWHECGHHRLGHLARSAFSRDVRVKRDRENEADCYAGEKMRQIGYTTEEIKIATDTLRTIGMGEDITHQNSVARADVVHQCYHK